MKNLNTCGRLPKQGNRLFHSCRQGFSSAFLLAAILLTVGCASRQQAPVPAAPGSRASVEKKLDPGVLEAARSNIGAPYRYGGDSPQSGFDCSGLVCWSYEQVGISLPRRARDQLMFGLKVDKNELQPGDIVVFKGTRGRSGWHSGIYSGDGKFIHSPGTGKTVTESELSESYFARRYIGATRIPRDGTAAKMYAEYLEQERAAATAALAEKKNSKNTAVASAKNDKARQTAKSKTSAKSRKTAQKPTVKSSNKKTSKS